MHYYAMSEDTKQFHVTSGENVLKSKRVNIVLTRGAPPLSVFFKLEVIPERAVNLLAVEGRLFSSETSSCAKTMGVEIGYSECVNNEQEAK